MGGRLQIATKYAAGLDRIASELETDVDRYESALQCVSAGNLALIGRMEDDPSELENPDVREFGMVLRQLAHVTRESMSNLAGMVESVDENAKLSRVLRGPSNRLTAALSRFTEATANIDEWDRRLQSLGIPVPPEDWEPRVGDDERGDVGATGHNDPGEADGEP